MSSPFLLYGPLLYWFYQQKPQPPSQEGISISSPVLLDLPFSHRNKSPARPPASADNTHPVLRVTINSRGSFRKSCHRKGNVHCECVCVSVWQQENIPSIDWRYSGQRQTAAVQLQMIVSGRNVTEIPAHILCHFLYSLSPSFSFSPSLSTKCNSLSTVDNLSDTAPLLRPH